MACSHTRMHACQQAQPVLHAHVLLCRVASHSSALQVEEMGPLVRGEQQKREGSQNALLRCPSSWWLALAASLMPADECGSGLAVVVVVVVSSGSAQQLQRRVLTDMRKGRCWREGRLVPL